MTDNNLVFVLKKNQEEFHPVVSFKKGDDKLLSLDFTATNKTLKENILDDIKQFCQYINEHLGVKKARYGVGGYGEHRTVYNRSKVFDATEPGGEPRRLHLGTDIWGRPLTPVMAPLDGIVHSYAFNNNFGDYGATIILSHVLSGVIFYTLYGHLSLGSIKSLKEGSRIKRGDVFAEFGIPSENGHWPPHLHFQLIESIGEWKGDYPGVCKFSEKEKWLANSPDPDLILQMNKFI